MPSAPPEAPSPITHHHDRHRKARHFEQVAGDGFGLSAFFGFEAGVGAGRVEQRDDGLAELGCHLHEAQRFAVALGVRHPEAAVFAFVGVAPLLVADDAHRAVARAEAAALERGEAAHDGAVVGKEAVAVELLEAARERADVVERVRPRGVARELDALPAREAGVDRVPEALDAPVERVDLGREVDGAVVGVELAELLELLLQLVDGLLEVEEMHGKRGSAPPEKR